MLKLGIKDRKLLYWLDQDSRATNKQLAAKVGLTEQAIGYKIKRLEEKGIIKTFVTFINTLSLGYQHYKVFIKLHNTTEEIEKELIQNLVKNRNIRWVVSTSGKYDLSFSILAKTPHEFITIYQKIDSEFGKYIAGKKIVLNFNSPGFTREWLIEGKESTKLQYKTNEEIQIVDRIDQNILKSISQHARKNIVDISREIGSSIDVVKYRLKKLKKRGVIGGFTVQFDLEKLGYEYYSIFFNMHKLTEETYKAIISFAKLHPNILFVVRVIGDYDIQLELEVKNYQELELILARFRRQFSDHISDFEILRVIKEYKYDFYPF